MKKLLVAFCAAILAVGAYAQQGTSAVGINLGVAPSLETGGPTNFGIAAKYQYGFTDALRGEVVLGYDFKAQGVSVFEAGVNVNYLFNLTEKFKLYPLVGLGYANLSMGMSDEVADALDDLDDFFGSMGMGSIKDEVEDTSSSASRLYVNAGIGLEYELTEKLALNLEVKYQYMKDYSRLPISVGVAYKF